MEQALQATLPPALAPSVHARSRLLPAVPLTVAPVIATVTATSLLGMVLGALFGLASAWIAPETFALMAPWIEGNVVGFCLFAGSLGGLFCGSFLGMFAVS